jgi:hypothetical protein
MSGPEGEFKMGWAMIGAIGLIFIANLLMMLAVNIANACRRAYLYYLRFKKRKQKTTVDQPVEAVFVRKAAEEADDLEMIAERDEESNASLRQVHESCLLIRVEDESGQETVRG